MKCSIEDNNNKIKLNEEFYHYSELVVDPESTKPAPDNTIRIHEDYHRRCIETDFLGDSSDEENQTYNELQSICIIDDREDYEFSVFYVYGNQVEFKRYKDQRHRPMTKYK
jgi:hypothetical protein